MALTAEAKPTYALANVAVEDDSFGSVAQAALQLSELYLNSKSGTIPWNQFPDILKTDIVARIPSSTGNSTDEED
jgi:predicted metal-binding protein